MSVERGDAGTPGDRVSAFDWDEAQRSLDAHGNALLPGLLTADECAAMTALYAHHDPFRSRVVMARYGFGSGEYKYFGYPLPDAVSALRSAIYPRLVAIANRWNDAMQVDVHYPEHHEEFIRRCHDAGQLRPTPLLLRYGEGDYNCLHQDLYGEHVFPIQLTVLLSQPGRDFEGGEFVLTEQRPRQQSRAEVVPLAQGDAVLFAVNQRPVAGAHGSRKVTLRHGVSRVRCGQRHALGIIFHDAR
ncbi:2OG-Fe(II) oxygenase [Montanilutibacter psychrotolerans]|uniref:Proline hydroxylase n=1 Tax=Montanilutibacter psychrotolerans TaxID=1327343 RepID=A0A3M8SWW9_9GAMM|nr:2OG-Fe(II) oxygenase [Lysobacter psychrotolerans]RNF83714.1 proline hydroxylase [Lysobacter psychrotolerans]